MGERLTALNTHLQSLIQLNQTNPGYDEDIKATVDEINKELGINSDQVLRSYSVKELYNEISTRINVFEVNSTEFDDVIVKVETGSVEKTTRSFPGNTKILAIVE